VWQFAHHSEEPTPKACAVRVAASVRLYVEATTASKTGFAKAKLPASDLGW
jgi:hypothetical protein